MRAPVSHLQRSRSRRAFLKEGLAASAGMSLLAGKPVAYAEDEHNHLTRGDVAMLRFAAAAEILESDLWTQNNELGGIQNNEAPGGSGNPVYPSRLKKFDKDLPQYIHDNADDEISHFMFLN